MNAQRLFESVLDRPPSGSPEACEAVMRLDSGQVWTRRVQRGSDLRVTCLRGQVWMTREGDSRDHFLGVEDTLTSREPGLVCVQAIAPSQLLVEWSA
jgi:hypothetical protein